MVDALNGSINLLITYDTASALPFAYGYYTPRASLLNAIPASIKTTRSKQAVIVESDCQSWSRNHKIKKLQEAGLDLYIMGDCGTVAHKECDDYDPRCFDILAEEYYFYLAIENSDCPDYITEKVWHNSFEAGMVPIVWATRIDYKRLLPPNSYINIHDYGNDFERAVSDITSAIASREEYMRYHEWRREYEITHNDNNFLLEPRLCDYAINNARREIPPIDIPAIRHCKEDHQQQQQDEEQPGGQ